MMHAATAGQLIETIEAQRSLTRLDRQGIDQLTRPVLLLAGRFAPYCVVPEFVSLIESSSFPTSSCIPVDLLPTAEGFAFLLRPTPVLLGEDRHPGQLVACFWTRNHPDVALVFGGFAIDEQDERVAVVWYDYHDGETFAEAIIRQRASLTSSARTVASLLGLLSQRIAVTTHTTMPRSFRRRMKRAQPGAVVPTVRIVHVRMPERESSHDDGHQRPEWSHRWVVRGFWRNQWMPSKKHHEPRYIASYVKGPADKPLVMKKTLYAVDR